MHLPDFLYIEEVHPTCQNYATIHYSYLLHNENQEFSAHTCEKMETDIFVSQMDILITVYIDKLQIIFINKMHNCLQLMQ